MRRATGALPLTGQDRRALAGGELLVALFTAGGVREEPISGVAVP